MTKVSSTATITISSAPPLEFWVLCSKQPTEKSGYILRMSFAEEARARQYYTALNIGRGYKKKLVAYSSLWGKRTLERAFS